MKINMIIYSVLFIYGTVAFAADDHSAMMNYENKANSSDKKLTEAGNDAFGTIQEVIRRLNSDPNTDWSKVNLEALRLHLLDMNDMTLNVEVISQKAIHNGLEAIVRPTTDRAALALERVFNAHPTQFKNDTGWSMKVVKNYNQYTMITTSDNPKRRTWGQVYILYQPSGSRPHLAGLKSRPDPESDPVTPSLTPSLTP